MPKLIPNIFLKSINIKENQINRFIEKLSKLLIYSIRINTTVVTYHANVRFVTLHNSLRAPFSVILKWATLH